MYLSKNEKIIGGCLCITVLGGLFYLSYKATKPSIQALDEYIVRKNPTIMTVKVSNQQREIEIEDFMKTKGYSIAKESTQIRTESSNSNIGQNRSFTTSSRTYTTQIITFKKN